MHFFYDAQSCPAMVEFNGTVYSYIHNLQGDVVGIVDSAGSLVVEYKYDAWGKPLSTTGTLADTLGKRNPFRYRSYIYDEETGLYYLETRYYNPEQCRFLGADEYLEQYISLVHNNAYAYCINNPVSKEDRDGQFFRELFSGGSAAVGVSWIVGSALIGIINTVKTAAVTVASVVTAITPVGWVAIGATAVLVTGAVFYAKRNKAKKTTKKSGKEKASDKPSWVNKDMVDKSLTPEENIQKWLNEKYGEGNWGKGAGSEYSQIKKWITRTEGVYYDSVRPSPRSAK